ncbi:hypothetical protein OAL00_02685 [Verrucomicrobiales bacterium]|nr:hypothetical protein [Verrucomicrobiales bacterium]
METEHEKDETNSISDDEKIREGQWKNCLGCICYAALFVGVAFLILVKCSKL